MPRSNVFVVSRTKRKNKRCWSVRTKNRVYAKCTTLAKARSQKRLLSALIYNRGFKRKSTGKRQAEKRRKTVRKRGK